MQPITVAAVQASPVFLDRDATVDKACTLIEKAAAEGARLMVFGETFIPTYPDWVWHVEPWSDGAWFARLQEQSVVIPSPATEQLGEVARATESYVAIGINEREEHGSTLFNTLLYIGPDGRVLGKHRKLVPTGAERLVWGMGDGSTLEVYDTDFGRLGGLICWENYMPLARHALYAQGIDVWVAPTWDNSEMWVPSMRHIAREGRMYVIAVAPCLRQSDIPADFPDRDRMHSGEGEWMSRGGAVIVDPEGTVLAGPAWEEETILYAEIDASKARSARRKFDPVGHYGRPDVFRVAIDTQARPPAAFE
jgi:nitrilase